MAKKKLDEAQVDYIIENHLEQTAQQMAVKLKCALWQVYSVCAENSIKPLKPKHFIMRLSSPPDLLSNNLRVASKTTKQISRELLRPPALYSNSSPYGIASELHK